MSPVDAQADGLQDPVADIVIAVYNALSLTRRCIESVFADDDRPPARVWLVDDGSDETTAHYLQEVAGRHPCATLLRNEQNAGYVKSCNLGIRQGSAPYVLLLNSDVVLPPGCLRRLVQCAELDRTIASVNPLTNRAAHLDVPMPPGASFAGVDRYLSLRQPACVDIVTGVGFCMLLRRAALEQVGVFDEAYGRGYCEESDLCMRLTQAGWRTVATSNCYVYHRGSGSFRCREERYLRNRRIFDQRWGAEYRRQFRAFVKRRPFDSLRGDLSGPRAWNPAPVAWQAARSARARLRAGAPLAAARGLIRAAFQLPRAWRQRPTPEGVACFERPGALRVTYLVPNTVVAGGVLSVVQLVNELVVLGHDARIATLFVDPAVREWMPLLAEPLVYRTERELLAAFPDSDLVVATHWTTVDYAQALMAAGKARNAVYFVQDYEPWFFEQEDQRQRVASTYSKLRHAIVKSDWLRSLVESHGCTVAKIPLGMDLSVYYPRQVPRRQGRIVAMARPSTPRRGFETLVEALHILRRTHPHTEIVLFGDSRLEPRDLGLVARNLGVITDQDRLAELYSTAEVFVDSSHFQGFGRCALEAMACGAAAVVTDVGGVAEYAKNGNTAITVEPRNPQALAGAVAALLDSPDLREQVAMAGRQETRRFCHLAEARHTARLFNTLVAQQ